MVALAHGTNDAQKTMGVITLTLITAGVLPPDAGPPFWVILSAGLAIALGTYMGGWRIIQTLGKRVSEIQTPQGFAAETSSATIILASSHLGFALSTTQVATGSIFGAGPARRLASVHWGVAGQMAIAWLLTLPAAAACRRRGRLGGRHRNRRHDHRGPRAGGHGGGIYAASRRRPVTADNVNEVPARDAASPRDGLSGETHDDQLGSARRGRRSSRWPSAVLVVVLVSLALVGLSAREPDLARPATSRRSSAAPEQPVPHRGHGRGGALPARRRRDRALRACT